jgi:hypothetical protein
MTFDINKPPVVNRAYKILYFTDEVEWPSGDYEELAAYLKDLKDKYCKFKTWNLNPNWTGYEDCHYEVEYTRYETDEELDSRIQNEEEDLLEWQQKYAEVVTKSMEKEDKEKTERLLQYEALKKEFEK